MVRERLGPGLKGLVHKGKAPGAAGVSCVRTSISISFAAAARARRPHTAGTCVSCTTREVVRGRMTEWLMESLRKDATEADMACPAPVEPEAHHQTVTFNRACWGAWIWW